MTFGVLQHRALDLAAGALLQNVDIRVRREVAGLPLQPLKADKNGVGSLNNPTTGGYFTDGKIRAYCAAGFYRVELLVDGEVVDTFYDVPVGLAQGTDATGRVFRVETINDLTALAVDDAAAVYVAGYHEAGDGGGGLFYGDTASAASDNGGTIFAPDLGTGRWLRAIPIPGIYSVKWFGARGDGATDDYAAILATAAALEDDGGKVVFPTGQYFSSGTAINIVGKKGITFEGPANGDGQIDVAQGGAEIVYTGTAGPLIRLDGTHAIEFRNLAISYNSASYTALAPLINLQSDAGPTNTFSTLFANCMIAGWNTSAKNAILIDAKNSIKTQVRGGYMRNAYSAVVGARAADQSDFCNDVVIDNVETDSGFTAAPFLVGGYNWSFKDLICEPPRGTSGGVSLDTIMATPYGVNGLHITNPSFYDGGNNTGSWINFNLATDYGAQGAVVGMVVQGGIFQCGTNAGGGLALDVGAAGVKGLVFKGVILNREDNIGFIGSAHNITDADITCNHVHTSAGIGVGKVFVSGVYPTDDSSVFDDNDASGTQFVSRSFRGSTSGGTLLKAGAVASGMLTLPSATDTLVCKATTDTLTNKTMGATTFTGALTFSMAGTLSAPNIAFNDPDTGFYGSAGVITMTLNGIQAGSYSTAGPTFLRNGAAVVFNFQRDDAHGASAQLMQITSVGRDSAAAVVAFGQIRAYAISTTASSHTGRWTFGTFNAGSHVETVRLEGTVLSPNSSGGTSLGSTSLPWSSVISSGAVRPGSFTVATLPAATAGDIVYCSNLRVLNGAGTQEAAAAGTGGHVTYNGSAWKIAGTNITAVA